MTMTRRQFLSIVGVGGAAALVAPSSIAKSQHKLMDPSQAQYSYSQIVQNTASFKFTGNDSEDVRRFLENGGMYRTEKRPASKKEFASVLYFEKPASFMTGTDNIVSSTGSQKTVGQDVKLAAGLYIFNYDTESGLTIRKMGSEKEVLSVALKPNDQLGILSEGSSKLNVTTHSANLAAIKSAIASTVSLYKDQSNFEMATLMERTIDCLESYQSDRAKLSAKETVRRLMSFMEEGLVQELTKHIAFMAIPPLGLTFPATYHDMARRELLATNNTVDNLLVSFEVERNVFGLKNTIAMVVHSGTEFERGSAARNPILQYRIYGSNKAGKVEFPNDYEQQFCGPIDGYDYDNNGNPFSIAQKKEDDREYMLTLLNQVVGGNFISFKPNEVKLFVVRISANAGDLQAAFADSYRRNEGK
ncbi:MAG: hypothetical protein QW568_03705 [Candidatus Anstonellaceae archaeon]